ncbi:unnamed protein product [Arabidopsis halleri]
MVYKTYAIDEDEEDFSEREYVENVENLSNITSTPLRSQPERMQKLESRAKTQCVFEDEDMSSDSDNKLPEAETSKEGNGLGEAHVISNLVESFEDKNSHDVVVECDDKAREIPGLTGSFTVEINLDCEPGSDSLVEKNWNKSGSEGIGKRYIEIIDLESDVCGSSKVVEGTRESGDKSEEPLKAQAEQEGPGNDGSKKRKKNTETCSSKNMKKKGIEAPTKKLDDWPELCPNFPFEPLTRSFPSLPEYLEQHFAATGSADTCPSLPDFALPSFSNIKISLNEEPASKKKKNPNPPCVQVASSSLPSCS